MNREHLLILTDFLEELPPNRFNFNQCGLPEGV
jgi:hypothetical protein